MKTYSEFIPRVFFLFLILVLVPKTLPAAETNNGQVRDALVSRTIEDDPFADETADPAKFIPLSDPMETLNRSFFRFNDFYYLKIMKPVTRGYEKVTTPGIRRAVRNLFNNILDVRNFVNSLLQFEFNDAGTSFGRILVNSTVGIGGLMDPASKYRQPVKHTFDETLGKWGLAPGIYIVWPVFGPASVRGTVGMAVDEAMDPLNYAGESAVSLGENALGSVSYASVHLPEYEDMKKYSIDPYSSLKNIYEKEIYRYHPKSR